MFLHEVDFGDFYTSWSSQRHHVKYFHPMRTGYVSTTCMVGVSSVVWSVNGLDTDLDFLFFFLELPRIFDNLFSKENQLKGKPAKASNA